MRLGLRQKVLFGMCALVVGSILSVAAITHQFITRAIEQEIRRDLLTTQQTFEQFQRQRFQQLLTLNAMVSEVPHLRAVMTTPDVDHATALDSAQGIQHVIRSDVFMICDAQGKLLASVSEPTRSGEDVTDDPAFLSALGGKPFQGVALVGGKVYQIVASPVLFGEEISGALLTGFVIDREQLDAMAQVSGAQVVLMSSGGVLGSSSRSELVDRFGDALVRLRQQAHGGIITQRFGDERYILLTGSLGSDAVSYCLARSLDKELQAFRAFQRSVPLVALGIMLIALPLGVLFSRQLSKPISALVEATKRIAAGDLVSKVPVTTLDEIGTLATAFNTMAEDLQKTTVSRDLLLKEVAARKQAELQLSEYAQRLEASNKELDDFTYIVSHDLKEPLRSIDAFSRFLEEEVRSTLSEESRNYLERIRANAGRMKALIEDLLELSRLAKRPNQLQQVSIAKVIDGVKGRFDYSFQERHVQLIVQEDLPVLTCDPVRLGEVFANLISNAIKYNDKPQPRIEIGGRAINGYYEFFVKDNGPGIEPQYFEKIFEIFKRLSKKEDQEGTGVGLTIVKKIVELHHGRVWVESTLGHGTTFYFTVLTDEQVLLGKKKLGEILVQEGLVSQQAVDGALTAQRQSQGSVAREETTRKEEDGG